MFRALAASTVALGLCISFGLPARAANTVFVDGRDPNCGGNGTPGESCFGTIREGVRNAGPGASQVRIAPGTYAESVDLSTMGDDIGSDPDSITLEGNGGTAVLAPTSGRSISNSEAPFPGSVTLRDLQITSPDRDALNLDDVAGSVTIERVLAEQAFFDGFDVDAQGFVSIVDSQALDNGDDGLQLYSDAEVFLRRVVAQRNGVETGGDGFEIEAERRLEIRASEATGNGDDGFNLRPIAPDGVLDRILIRKCEARDNGAEGFETNSRDDAEDTSEGLVVDVQIRKSTAEDNGGDGFQIDADGEVVLRKSVSNGNDGDGYEIGANETTRDQQDQPERIRAKNVTANGNGEEGIELHADGTVRLRACEAEENEDDGVQITTTVLDGGDVTLARCDAVDNGSDGIDVTAGGGILAKRLTADGNGFDGFSDGIDLQSFSGGSIRTRKLSATGNAEEGVQIRTGGIVLLRQIEVLDNGAFDPEDGTGNGVLVNEAGCPFEEELCDLSPADRIFASDVAAEGNGDEGFQVSEAEGEVELDQVCVEGNDGGGILVKNTLTAVSMARVDALSNAEAGVCLIDVSEAPVLSRSNVAGNGDGLVLFGEPPAGPVDATGNWWGDSDGPTHPDNEGGSGDSIVDGDNGGSGEVDFSEFSRKDLRGSRACF